MSYHPTHTFHTSHPPRVHGVGAHTACDPFAVVIVITSNAVALVSPVVLHGNLLCLQDPSGTHSSRLTRAQAGFQVLVSPAAVMIAVVASVKTQPTQTRVVPHIQQFPPAVEIVLAKPPTLTIVLFGAHDDGAVGSLQ